MTNPEVLQKVLLAKVQKIAVEVQAYALTVVPHDTGTLGRSIAVSQNLGTGPKPEVRVGTPVFYAPFVEYGTKHMAAQPYLGPALSTVKAKYGL
jgi:HK97 gp10 family phage protein